MAKRDVETTAPVEAVGGEAMPAVEAAAPAAPAEATVPKEATTQPETPPPGEKPPEGAAGEKPPATAAVLKTVEQWAKELETAPWKFQAARVGKRWPVGKEITESAYATALDDVDNVKCG